MARHSAQQIRDEINNEIGLQDNDIICGRASGKFSSAGGNYAFRKLVNESRELYEMAERTEKVDISKMVVDQILQRGGRFIYTDPETDQWAVMPYKKAIEKTSQTFRDLRAKPEMNYRASSTRDLFDSRSARFSTPMRAARLKRDPSIGVDSEGSVSSKPSQSSKPKAQKVRKVRKIRKVKSKKKKIKKSIPKKVKPAFIEAAPTDILSGRGNLPHPGNRAYQVVIRYNRMEYSRSTEDEKQDLCESIANAIHTSGCRFLTCYKNESVSMKLTDEQVKRKIYESLRYNTTVVISKTDTFDFIGICGLMTRHNIDPHGRCQEFVDGLLDTDIAIDPKSNFRYHAGNLAVEKFVSLNMEHFRSLTEKRELNSTAELIIAMLHSQGARFVESDGPRGVWVEAQPSAAVGMVRAMLERPTSPIPGGRSFKQLCTQLIKEPKKVCSDETPPPPPPPTKSRPSEEELREAFAPPMPPSERAASSHIYLPEIPISIFNCESNTTSPPLPRPPSALSRVTVGDTTASSSSAHVDNWNDDGSEFPSMPPPPPFVPSSSEANSFLLFGTSGSGNTYLPLDETRQVSKNQDFSGDDEMAGPFASFPAPPEFICMESFSSVWGD